MSSEKHTVHLELDEEDLQLLFNLMQLGEKQSQSIIKRSKNFPSETILSKITIEKHENIIYHIDYLRNHLAENSTR
jgi:hypothetical protein